MSANKLQSITASPELFEGEEEIPSDLNVSHTVTTTLPEIKSVQQKGQGLAALRRSLSMFTDSTPVSPTEAARNETSSSTTSQDELRQRRLEKDTYEAAISRWREENAQQKKIGIDASLSTNSVGALMWAWHEALVPLIREEVQKANEAEGRTAKSPSDKERCQYGPFLRLLPVEKISAATILTTMTILSTDPKLEDGIKLAGLVLKIGTNIQDESLVEIVRVQAQRRMKEPQLSRQVTRARTAITKYPSSRYSYARLLDPGERTSELVESLKWTGSTLAKIGSVLLSQLMEVAKVDIVSTRAEKPVTMERQPVFFHTFRYVDGKRQGIVRLNKAVFEKLSREPVKSVLSKNLPMIVKPRPWTGFREGGFLEHHIPVVRIQGGLERRYAITASDNGDMDQTFGGLTVLGKTPWQINRPVFETMLEAWNTGEAIAKIPPLNPNVEPPPEPSKTLVDYPAQRLNWLKQLKTIENLKSGLRSVRCYQNFQLEIARAYIDETFYFPHNLDFRGRAYPISPLFNHMCSDNVRGLLIFAEGKELGEAGLRWLKIHLANVYGFDKASFAERENFATDHLSDIYDSVESPLNGKRWWLKAEDPWQCLAACIELKNAFLSEDPHRFVSHLPVHQDGTCNGLQHYAALGGDSLGAKQVNLEPGDRPSDIYTAVSELVKMEVKKDSAQGNKVAQALEGKVTRKLVKQTVMTNVYGVTFIGAQRQVRRQLTEIFSAGRTVGSIGLREMATYIATNIFSALSTMFNGAHDIQYWLGNCASRISESLAPEQIDLMLDGDRDKHKNADYKRVPSVRKSIEGPTAFKTPVIWTNPMGMPVVQPYRQATSQRVSTNLQTVSIKAHSGADPVSKRKQFQAFPPNFIHSLDASHMVLTALKCDEIGLTFAAVHDSFWTHATDVNSMNGIIRDSFIRMHSENIMDRLAAEFSARYKDYIYLASVKASSTVGRKIRAWRKTIGTNAVRKLSNAAKLVELRTERLRCKLLASNDADERDRGASMVTAASIFEEAADEKELLPRQSPGTSLGEVLSARTTKLEANEQLKVGDVDNTKLLDAATEDFDLDVSEHLESSLSDMYDRTSEAEDENAKPGIKKKWRQERRIRFWMPLTFPPVPKKVSTTLHLIPGFGIR